jgi:hypothetical protein
MFDLLFLLLKTLLLFLGQQFGAFTSFGIFCVIRLVWPECRVYGSRFLLTRFRG